MVRREAAHGKQEGKRGLICGKGKLKHSELNKHLPYLP